MQAVSFPDAEENCSVDPERENAQSVGDAQVAR
jgi:hypothetical protein